MSKGKGIRLHSRPRFFPSYQQLLADRHSLQVYITFQLPLEVTTLTLTLPGFPLVTGFIVRHTGILLAWFFEFSTLNSIFRLFFPGGFLILLDLYFRVNVCVMSPPNSRSRLTCSQQNAKGPKNELSYFYTRL